MRWLSSANRWSSLTFSWRCRPGDKGDVAIYGENDSQFIVEVFRPERKLLTIEEFLSTSNSNAGQPQVFVLDLNGHFVAALTLEVDGVKSLVVLQTMQGRMMVELRCD